MNLSPILIFCYARKNHLEFVIESLKTNEDSKSCDLYIYSDAAKNSTDLQGVNDVRSYIHNITGFKKIFIIERKENFGLAKSIITGVGEVIQKYDSVIVLEDDTIVSGNFLSYMNKALAYYKDNMSVISIHGYTLPVEDLPDLYFLKGADCWGWATWKRGWDLFDENSTNLYNQLKSKKLSREFDFNYTYPYMKMLRDQSKGLVDSWAIRWYASAFLKNKFTLYPGKSLVTNIGLDGSGIHCGVEPELNSEIINHSSQNIDLISFAGETSNAKKAIEKYNFKRLTTWNKVKCILKRILK